MRVAFAHAVLHLRHGQLQRPILLVSSKCSLLAGFVGCFAQPMRFHTASLFTEESKTAYQQCLLHFHLTHDLIVPSDVEHNLHALHSAVMLTHQLHSMAMAHTAMAEHKKGWKSSRGSMKSTWAAAIDIVIL